MTTVKVQRAIRPEGSPWLVYDKFRARECLIDEQHIPASIKAVFNAAPQGSQGYYKQYFDDAVWDEEESWDLSAVKPVTRRLIW